MEASFRPCEGSGIHLFPGDSCYPISKRFKNRVNAECVSQNDQMRVIVRRFAHQLGEQDLSFISREDSQNYIQNICRETEALRTSNGAPSEPSPLKNSFNFAKELKDVPKEMVQILENMLQFNPYMRHSANECLQSPLFAGIKISEQEIAAPSKILLEVDKDDAFDYSNASSSKFMKVHYL